MELYLKVNRFDDDFVDYDLSATFGVLGGSIGRAAQNNLILPDEDGYVSRIHAKIESDGDDFYIIDSSSNGTLLLELFSDEKEEAYNEVFIHEDRRVLLDGNYIVIGHFEIEIQIRVDSSGSVVDIVQEIDKPQEKADSILPEIQSLKEQEFNQPVFTSPPVAEKHIEDYQLQSVDVTPLQHQFTVPEAKGFVEENVTENEAIEPEEFNIDDFFADDSVNDQIAADDSVNGHIAEISEEEDIFAGFQDPFVDPLENEQNNQQAFQTEEPPAFVEESAIDSDLKEPIDINSELLKAEQNIDTGPSEEVFMPLDEETDSPPIPAIQSKQEAELPLQNKTKQVLEPEKHEQNNIQGSGEAFLKGVGLNINELPDGIELDQLMLNAGKMLRTLLDANIALLKARADLKREFSSALTVVQKEENNPLKFCQSIDDVLPYLFFENSPGFLSGQRAVYESVSDLRTHQMAMMAGIQAAIQGTVDVFDPAIVENVCEKGHFNKGSKCWDFYKSSYKKLSKEVQADFFGNDFAVAYEKQVMAMKKQDRSE